MAARELIAAHLRDRRRDLGSGFALSGFIFCLVAAHQLGMAAAELFELKAEPDPLLRNPTWPKWAWPLVLVPLGAALTWVVYRALLVRLAGVSSGTRTAFTCLSVLGFALWLGWQAVGIAVFWGADRPDWADVLLYAAAAVTLAALAVAGRAVGNPIQAARGNAAVLIQVIVLGALVLATFVIPITSAQMNDVLRAWGDGPLSRVAVGIAGALLMGAVVRTSASRLLAPFPRGERWQKGRIPGLVIAVAAALAFVALHAWLGLVLLAAVVALAWATEWTKRPEPTDPERYEKLRLAGTLGVLPLAVVYAGLVAALTDSLLLPSHLTGPDKWLLGATLGVAVVFGLLTAFSHPLEQRGFEQTRSYASVVGVVAFLLAAFAFLDVVSVLFAIGAAFVASWALPERGGSPFWAAAGAALGMATAVYVDPVGVPSELGALGIVLVAGAGALAALHLVASLGARRKFRGQTRLKGVPVLLLLIAWVVAAWQLGSSTLHQVPTDPRGTPPSSLVTAVETWLDREAGGGEQRVPMVVVAASGGGAKAAYWTDLVIDCLFGGGPPPKDARECSAPPPDQQDRFGRLFLTSSVSGGSIGVYHAVLDRHPSEPWVDLSNDPEVLSPVLAWGLFHDLPAFMLGVPTDPRDCTSGPSCLRGADRALVQEAAIAHRDEIDPSGEPMLVENPLRLPVTVFNAAQDGAERRVLISPVLLDSREPGKCRKSGAPLLGPDALDAHELMAGSPIQASAPDVPLGVAAHMSARFPVVEPAATLGEDRPPVEKAHCSVGARSVVLRDGGYVENSGVLTVEDLLPYLRSAIDGWKKAMHRASLDVPIVVVSVDDDPMSASGEPELELVPSTLGITKQAGKAALTAGSRNRIRRCVYDNVHYERISPGLHVGAEAATGWEISETARTEDLIASLQPTQPAWEDLESVKEVMEGTSKVSCPAP